MSLSNPSQLLLRNEEYLKSSNPLVVNCPDNEFIPALERINENATISNFQINYAYYLAQTQRQSSHTLNQFSHNYDNQSGQQHDLLIFYFPKSKAEFLFMLAMLKPHLTAECSVLLVGENNGGVKSALKLCKDQIQFGHKIDSARHCTLMQLRLLPDSANFNLDDWFKTYQLKVNDITIDVVSLPGVFSIGELDKGTQLLLQHLPQKMQGKVLDFGCGAGVIGSYIQKRYPQTEVDMLDVNALAIASSQKTLELNKLCAKVFASDGLSTVKGQYQAVISNPPFHQGLKTHYHTTESFLAHIKQHLHSQGTLTIVANSFLKYAPIIEQAMGNNSQLAQSNGFTIHHSVKK
ncbi:methyltransferase [Thalassotalea aquiviva]|uniref:methyltransferase n=1 Tax=Thalassotalea aquiviva TaxID=3242415 RepID=UPI00352B0B76